MNFSLNKSLKNPSETWSKSQANKQKWREENKEDAVHLMEEVRFFLTRRDLLQNLQQTCKNGNCYHPETVQNRLGKPNMERGKW